jgi:hypothetical protein
MQLFWAVMSPPNKIQRLLFENPRCLVNLLSLSSLTVVEEIQWLGQVALYARKSFSNLIRWIFPLIFK